MVWSGNAKEGVGCGDDPETRRDDRDEFSYLCNDYDYAVKAKAEKQLEPEANS